MQTTPSNPVVVIREGVEADLDGVIDAFEIVAGEKIHIGTEIPIDRQAMKQRMRQTYLDSEKAVIFVVLDEGRIVGCLNTASRNGLADLGMLLLPDYRGRGIGSALMVRCIQWCRDHGCHKISLEVWPHNKPAIHLYEKFGFVREGLKRRERKRRSGEIWDIIQMGLILD